MKTPGQGNTAEISQGQGRQQDTGESHGGGEQLQNTAGNARHDIFGLTLDPLILGGGGS